nr:hypothetical protein [Tanacetum cinerariifolium]
MADQRTMAELLCAPIEGYAEAIVVPSILAEQFELKHSLTNMMTSDQFFGLEKDNPPDHIRVAHRWLEKEPSRSIYTWEDLVSKFINEFFPPQERQISVMKSLIFNNGGNLLERRTQDVLMIIENKYKFLAASGNTFPELRDNIQGYVSAAAVNYNQGNSVYYPPGSGSLPSNTVANPKGKLKDITTRSEETLTDPDLSEYTIKVPPPPVQKYKPLSQREYVVHQRDPFYPNIPYPSRMLKQKQQEKDEIQIHKFWQMFKQLYINITLTDALILMPKYQKILKALLSNKEKLQEL